MANLEHLAILKQGVAAWNKWREDHPDVRPDLRGADLSEANLGGANLSGADLREADLRKASLIEANLRGADLVLANLTGVHLSGADVSRARFDFTVLGDNDLSQTKGLDTAVHEGPSTIGTDTIQRSGGKIPEVFLRGAGVPDNWIEYIGSLVGQPIRFYSCFIS